jgi:hypothetical protein
MPPSTIMCVSPVSSFWIRTGSKKTGMLMLIRTARPTSSSSGSIPSRRASRGSTSSWWVVTSEAITCSRERNFGSDS